MKLVKKLKSFLFTLVFMLCLTPCLTFVACGKDKNDLSKVSMTLEFEQAAYTGNAIEPGVILEYDGKNLDETKFTITYSNNINVGTATVTVTVPKSNKNYKGSISKNFNITKAANSWVTGLTISDEIEYGQELDAHAVAAIGEVEYIYSADNDTFSADKPTDAGTYYVKAVVNETANYDGLAATEAIEFKIVPIANSWITTLTINDGEDIYYGDELIPNAVAKYDNEHITYVYSDTIDGEYTTALRKNVKDTPYYVKAVVTGRTNYQSLVSDPVAFYIKKATNKFVDAPTLESWFFDGTAHTPAVVKDKFGNEAVVTYSTEENGEYVADAFVNASVNAYWVKFEIAETENYEGVVKKLSYTISRLAVETPVLANANYTGENIVLDFGCTDNELPFTVEEYTAVDVGTYNIVLTLKDQINCYWEDDDGAASLTIVLNIVKTTNEWVVAPSIADCVYNTPVTPTAEALVGEVVFTYGDNAEGEGFVAVAPKNVGSYYLKATVVETSNYTGLETIVAFEIVKADNEWTIAPTIENWLYGNPSNLPTASSKYNTETPVDYKYSSEEDGEYTYVVPTSVGTHYLKATVAASDNYNELVTIIAFEITAPHLTINEGTEQYHTFASALEAAEDGDIVVLHGNFDFSEPVEIDKSITIDASNYDISMKDDFVGDALFVITSDIDVVIKNAEIKGVNATNVVVKSYADNLTLQNVVSNATVVVNGNATVVGTSNIATVVVGYTSATTYGTFTFSEDATVSIIKVETSDATVSVTAVAGRVYLGGYTTYLTSTDEELKQAIANGDDLIIISGKIEVSVETLAYSENAIQTTTFVGFDDEAELDFTAAQQNNSNIDDAVKCYNATGSTITFTDLVITLNSEAVYADNSMRIAEKEVYNNCVINGVYYGYADKVEFNECEFYQTTSNYNVVTWRSDIDFNRCSFEAITSAVYVYNTKNQTVENLGQLKDCDVNFDDCVMVAQEAIVINCQYANFVVNVDANTTCEGNSDIYNFNCNVTNRYQTTKTSAFVNGMPYYCFDAINVMSEGELLASIDNQDANIVVNDNITLNFGDLNIPENTTVTFAEGKVLDTGRFNVRAENINFNEGCGTFVGTIRNKFMGDIVVHSGEFANVQMPEYNVLFGHETATVTFYTHNGNDYVECAQDNPNELSVGTYFVKISVPAVTATDAIVGYTALESEYIQFTVTKATLNITYDNTIVAEVGVKLSEVALDEGWAWVENENQIPSAIELTAGYVGYLAIFTPDNVDNYNTVTMTLYISVSNPENKSFDVEGYFANDVTTDGNWSRDLQIGLNSYSYIPHEGEVPEDMKVYISKDGSTWVEFNAEEPNYLAYNAGDTKHYIKFTAEGYNDYVEVHNVYVGKVNLCCESYPSLDENRTIFVGTPLSTLQLEQPVVYIDVDEDGEFNEDVDEVVEGTWTWVNPTFAPTAVGSYDCYYSFVVSDATIASNANELNGAYNVNYKAENIVKSYNISTEDEPINLTESDVNVTLKMLLNETVTIRLSLPENFSDNYYLMLDGQITNATTFEIKNEGHNNSYYFNIYNKLNMTMSVQSIRFFVTTKHPVEVTVTTSKDNSQELFTSEDDAVNATPLEMISDINVQVEGEYEYEILLNNQEYKENFAENIFQAMNMLTVKVIKDSGVVYYNYYFSIYSCPSLVVKDEQEVLDDLYIGGTSTNSVENEYDFCVIEQDDNAQITYKNLSLDTPQVKNEGENILLQEGLNIIEITKVVDNFTVVFKYYIYKLAENEAKYDENMTSISDDCQAIFVSDDGRSASTLNNVTYLHKNVSLDATKNFIFAEFNNREVTYGTFSWIIENKILKFEYQEEQGEPAETITFVEIYMFENLYVVDDNVHFSVLKYTSDLTQNNFEEQEITFVDKVANVTGDVLTMRFVVEPDNPGAMVDIVVGGKSYGSEFETPGVGEYVLTINITSADKTKTDTYTINFTVTGLKVLEIEAVKEGAETPATISAIFEGLNNQDMPVISGGYSLNVIMELELITIVGTMNYSDFDKFDSEGNLWVEGESNGDMYVKMKFTTCAINLYQEDGEDGFVQIGQNADEEYLIKVTTDEQEIKNTVFYTEVEEDMLMPITTKLIEGKIVDLSGITVNVKDSKGNSVYQTALDFKLINESIPSTSYMEMPITLYSGKFVGFNTTYYIGDLDYRTGIANVYASIVDGELTTVVGQVTCAINQDTGGIDSAILTNNDGITDIALNTAFECNTVNLYALMALTDIATNELCFEVAGIPENVEVKYVKDVTYTGEALELVDADQDDVAESGEVAVYMGAYNLVCLQITYQADMESSPVTVMIAIVFLPQGA